MYQPTYSSASQQPYSPPSDPYRAAPISVPQKQPYNAAFSPPAPGPANGFSPMPSGHSSQRYQIYSSSGSGPQSQSHSHSPRQSSSAPRHHTPSGYSNGGAGAGAFQHPGIPPQQTPQQRFKGTLAPGTVVKVGEQHVRVERYLSEGGYAHVYLTSSERPIYPPTKEEKKGRWGERGYSQHCLKRIAFEDEAVWVDVRKEIEVMKSLPPNPHLTQYLGSAHSRLPNGGYEVFILMEFCAGGGIIDLLNKRLRDRLKEIEILNIFADVCEAVAAMHSLKRPLLHRDLKIENVLSHPSSSSPTPQRPTPLIFKLCDFGSTTFPSTHPPQTKIEADALALDLNKHTTLQYRSPEMVEPMLGWPVGLPSDVWALGVLLYKLCYYTTPFEEHGTLAIVNAKYTFPQYPVYSPRMQHLIASMLVDHPSRRPSVFEVLKIAHEMSGTRPEVDYPTPSHAFSVTSPPLPPRAAPQSSNLLDFTSPTSPSSASPVMQPLLASTVQPQRRGRPTREPSRNAAPPAQLPPMPQPPSVPQPSSAPAPAKPPLSKLQVTGEEPSLPAKSLPSPGGGLDAFGLPSKSIEAAKVEDGFGDSFGAPQQGVKATAAKFGGTAAARSSSGFDDSFGVQRKSLSPKKSVPAVSGGSQTSPSRRRDPSSSIPDGGLSFEARFPSIETLSSGDTFSPSLPQPPSAAPEHLISPVTSPPVSRPGLHPKASVMSHLTGETAPPHISIGSGIPQPRSTQVTGTAFKGIQGGMLSPSPLQPRTDYFESANLQPAERKTSPAQTGSSAKSPLPQDLMTGEEFNELSVPLMRPGRTPSPGVSASVASVPSPGFAAKSPPTSGHSRPLLPHISSIKPSSNINSEQWSPLERMRNKDEGGPRRGPSPAELAAALEPDSSDEEVEQPEEASGTSRRPASPVRRGSGNKLPPSPKIAQRMSMFENDFGATASLPQRQASPTKSATAQKFPIKSATLQIPADVRPEARRGSGSSSEGRSRPQSMFIPSTSPMLSPNDPGTAPLEQGPRPAHSRQGSIGDMVSRYENLKSPSAAPSGEPPATASKVGPGSGAPVNGAGGLGRKPSVAAKPAALRRGTITNDKPAPPELEAPSKAPMTVSSPTKSSSKSESKPAVAAKPAIQPKPVRYGDMPAVAGYSRSSSGRSFPITKPMPEVSKPSIDTSVVDADAGRNVRPNSSDEEKGEGGPRSGSGSPEKQQPVSSLIARWNKGEVGGKPPPAKRGGYI